MCSHQLVHPAADCYLGDWARIAGYSSGIGLGKGCPTNRELSGSSKCDTNSGQFYGQRVHQHPGQVVG